MSIFNRRLLQALCYVGDSVPYLVRCSVKSNSKFKYIGKPLLLIAALIITLSMLRLGVWQLDRAEQKRSILEQTKSQSEQPLVGIKSLLNDFDLAYRFREVSLDGRFLADETLYLDNQTHNSHVGYHLMTPLQLKDSDVTILINRGWISVGESRQQLPRVNTPEGEVKIIGRLNLPAAQPPLWNEDYPVSSGAVWQYLPVQEYAAQMQRNVLPLVVELAPDQAGSDGLQQQWSTIDDKWVAKHQGYAFQWFSMALAFFIACLVLLLRNRK